MWGFFSIFWAKLWLSIALRPVKNCKFRAFRLWSGLQNSVWSLELNVRMPQRLGKCPRESSCPAILEAMQEQGIKSTAEPQLCKMWISCYFSTQYLRKSWSLKWAGKGKRRNWTGEGGREYRIWFFKAVHFALLEWCVASNTHDGIKPSWLVGTGHKILQHNAFCM